MKRRRDPGFARWTLGFPILVLFLLTNKVYSPQFSLWLLPWFALALPKLRLFVAFEIADVAVFVTRFSWFGTYVGIDDGFAGLPLGAFQIAVVVRAVILVVCVIAWIRAEGGPVQAPDEARAGRAGSGSGGGHARSIRDRRRPTEPMARTHAEPPRAGSASAWCSSARRNPRARSRDQGPVRIGDWSDGRPYTRLCYTDIIPCSRTEQLTGGRLPYLDPCAETEGACDEYPVLTMWMMRFTAWASGPDGDAVLLAERDPAVARRLLDRLLPVSDGRAPRPVLRARADARDLRDDELGPARGRARDGGRRSPTCDDATSGRACCSGSAPRRSSTPRCSSSRSSRAASAGSEPDRGIHLAWAAAGNVDRAEPAVRARRDHRVVGVLPLQLGRVRPTGTACGSSRANGRRVRRARTRA